MDRHSDFFQHNEIAIHYSLTGRGTIPIFLFHGFGVDSTIFQELEKKISDKYIIYNFDLPYHGKTKWREGEEPITHEFWKELLEAFCHAKNISSFSLLGYSIGARLVWSAAFSLPHLVKELIVIAPDGIKDNFWYSLATRFPLGRSLFKKIILNNHIQKKLRIGKLLRLAPKTTVRFAEGQLLTNEQRHRVYYTWIVFRKLSVEPTILAKCLNQYAIPTTIYLGSQDKIITQRSILPLIKKITNKKVVMIEAGHSNLVKAVAANFSK